MKYHEMVEKLNGLWTSSSDIQVDFSEIVKIIKETNCEVYVGSDSNPSKIPHTLAVSIAVIKKRHFAKYFYVRWNPWGTKKPDMRTRLVDEVVTSCHVAMKIKNELPEKNIHVHADLNPSKEAGSGRYSMQLKNLISSYGFEAEIKPDSWAASWLADKLAG